MFCRVVQKLLKRTQLYVRYTTNPINFSRFFAKCLIYVYTYARSKRIRCKHFDPSKISGDFFRVQTLKRVFDNTRDGDRVLQNNTLKGSKKKKGRRVYNRCHRGEYLLFSYDIWAEINSGQVSPGCVSRTAVIRKNETRY